MNTMFSLQYRGLLAGAMLFCLLSSAGGGTGSLQTEPYQVPDYTGFMVHFFERGVEGVQHWEERYDPGTALIALRLWEATGKEGYRKIGQTLFRNIMAKAEDGEAGSRWLRQYGDFDSHPIVCSAFLLDQRGLLASPWKALIRSEVLALQEQGLYWRHGNRELGKLAGPIFAAFQFFPNDRAFDPLRSRTRQWWQDLNRVGCLDESSGNYSSLGLSLLVTIAQAMDRESDLRNNPRWRNTFTMYRDLVSPSGHMPEWGDDYFDEGGKLTWCYLFEYAANLYEETSFALAARKLFYRHIKYFDQKARVKLGSLRQSLDMLNVKPMASIHTLSFVSGVNYRYDPAGAKRPFALLMRPDLEPGSPMLMMDLYSLGDHAHMEKRGSVTYYEANHIPLFAGRGRRNGRHAGDGGNNLYLQPDSVSFPMQPWKRDTWYTVRVPAERFGHADAPGKDSNRLFTHYYGNFRNKKGATLYLDNLRLEGPAGVDMIDGFDDLVGGTYSTARVVKTEEADRTVLEIPAEATSFSMRKYNKAFGPLDYRVLAYDIKWTGPEIPDIGFRYDEDSLNMYNAWHSPGPLRPFYADLRSARTDTRRRDCYGEVDFSGYGAWDTPHTRRLVLTQEGILVIRDTLMVGPSAGQWTGGEVWQFVERQAQGQNWFAGKVQEGLSCVPADANSYDCGMLVVFDRGNDDVFASRQVPWGPRQRWLAYTRFTLRAGQRYIRTVVVVPYRVSQRPERVVEDVTMSTSEASTRVTYESGSVSLTVLIDEKGHWKVTREDDTGLVVSDQDR